MRKGRICEIDYLKCVFIIIMILAHLVFVGDAYPYFKVIITLFVMPCFLLMSGYFANMDKTAGRFFHGVKWLFIPYAIMESLYTVLASVLPVREHVDYLSVGVVAEKVFLHPLGPYWYLHTMIICYLIYYIVNRLRGHLNQISFVIVLGVCYWLFSEATHILAPEYAMYFLAGVWIRQSGASFMKMFMPSYFAIVPFALLCMSPEGMIKLSLKGLLMVYFVISFFLALHKPLPEKIKRVLHFVGENTLCILLFSPAFTIITKQLVPFFAFDRSLVLLTVVSVVFVIIGSMAIAFVMDRLKLSRFFCGKERFLNTDYLKMNVEQINTDMARKQVNE
jgi:fucose 4-O-acetylase-like acetyltransferase